MTPDPHKIIAAIDECDAIIEIASDALEEGASQKVQVAIATCLRGTRNRLAALANELDAFLLEQEKANRTPAPIPEPVRAELEILDEIKALNEALRTVEARQQ